jgi:predicted nucleotide-binding protein
LGQLPAQAAVAAAIEDFDPAPGQVQDCVGVPRCAGLVHPDDTRTKRHQLGAIPRVNVVFELGLFMGALGRERVFMVVQAGTDLPTDLAGIAPAQFNTDDDHINLVSALGPTTTMLEIAMDLI